MRPTRAIIDLSAIAHNVRTIKAATPNASLTAVVKANAYGHGAVPVANTALAAGASGLAVAIPEEGIELREAGISQPVLLLGLTLPEQADDIVAHNLTATVCTEAGLTALATAARKFGRRARTAIKVDTGMSRIGIPADQAAALVALAASMPEIELRAIFTHLASADAADKKYAYRQLDRFAAAVQSISNRGVHIPALSAANSAAIIDFPQLPYDTVRPGIILYGLPPSEEMHNHLDLRPAMALETQIVHIKEVAANTPVSYGCTYTTNRTTRLATLPIGYADGYSRHLSNLAPVLIRGKRYPVVGRICMDQTIVDLGPDGEAALGEKATLFGRQGDAEITVTELAGLAGTINYELVCAVSARVPRIYIH